MNHSPIRKAKYAKDVYDAIPVYYCKQCLSLNIRYIPGVEGTDYCDDCNSTNIHRTSINEWDYMYQQRYGYKFLEKPEYYGREKGKTRNQKTLL